MNASKLAAVLALVLTMVLGFNNFSNAQYEREGSSMSSKYHELVDNFLEQCQNKIFLSTSKSESVRNCAAEARLKKSFVETHKEKLIAEMVHNRIEQKPYKIKYFLNQKFNDAEKD